MTKTSSAIIAVLIAAAFPAASYAAARDPNVNQRQQHQQQRMQQGVRSGELTRNEYHNLQGQARDIRREERVYRADGNFTRAEKLDLHRDLNHLSRDIHSERHDGQRQFQNQHPATVHPGFRHSDSHDIDRIQQVQRNRIELGVRSGELTRSEAGRLIIEQRRIEQEERSYRADGVLTRDERLDLRQDLNAAGQHIYRETHDAQVRFR